MKTFDVEQSLRDRRASPLERFGRGLSRFRRASGSASSVLGLVAIWIALSFLSPYFLTTSNVLNLLVNSATLAILAAGVTVTLIAGEIDLSIASVEAFVGSLFAVLLVHHGVPWPAAAAIAIAASIAVGIINGFFVTRVGMPSFVTTLAMLSLAQGFALVITNGTAISGFPNNFEKLGTGTVLHINVPIIIAAAIVCAIFVLLKWTRFGLNVYAVGSNPEAARLAGVNVQGVKRGVFVLSSLTAGLAGLLLAARIGAGSGTVAQADLLDAIAAAAIGGTSLMGGVGGIPGTVVGVLLIASINNGLVLLNVSAFWQQVAIGGLILGVVLLDHLAKRERN